MLVLVPDMFSQVPLPVKDLSAAFAWTFEIALLLALELLKVCFEQFIGVEVSSTALAPTESVAMSIKTVQSELVVGIKSLIAIRARLVVPQLAAFGLSLLKNSVINRDLDMLAIGVSKRMDTLTTGLVKVPADIFLA